jgi:hypothetical protein
MTLYATLTSGGAGRLRRFRDTLSARTNCLLPFVRTLVEDVSGQRFGDSVAVIRKDLRIASSALNGYAGHPIFSAIGTDVRRGLEPPRPVKGLRIESPFTNSH